MKHWPIGLAAVLGLLAGYLLWGRGVPPATVQATIDQLHRAEALNRGNEAVIQRLADLWVAAERRADSAVAAMHAHRTVSRTRAAEADTALRQGDTTRAVPLLVAAVEACDAALSACDVALAAKDAAIAGRDTALALRDQTIDSLIAGTHRAVTVLGRVRAKPWAVGPVFDLERGRLIGGELDRDIGPVRLTFAATRDDLRGSAKVRF